MTTPRGFPASDGTRWSRASDANVRTYAQSATIADLRALCGTTASISQRCALWHIAKRACDRSAVQVVP